MRLQIVRVLLADIAYRTQEVVVMNNPVPPVDDDGTPAHPVRVLWGAMAAIALCAVSTLASASDQPVASEGRVRNLRVEAGQWLFIELTADNPLCPGRMFTDISQPFGRAIHATVLLAAAQSKPVVMRGWPNHPKLYGACPIHDVVLIVE
jgi:hypothetical protein